MSKETITESLQSENIYNDNDIIPRALIIEDNKILCRTTSHQLEMIEIKSDFVENGKTALEILKHNHYDFILCDIGLPDIDGWHLVELINKSYDIPIFILSAHAPQEKIDQYKNKKFIVNFILKPVSINSLKSLLSEFLK